MTTESSASPAFRHEVFYAAQDIPRSDVHAQHMVIIKVENCLFRVSASQLSKYSPIFADMFSLPQVPEDTEGRSDETPIRMEGVPRAGFEQYLYMAREAEFNDKLDTQLECDATEALLARLAAVARWDASALHPLLKSDLVKSDNPILQLLGARQLEIQHWVWPAYFRLAIIPTPPTADLRNSILSQLPQDLDKITQIRATVYETGSEMTMSPMRLEMYIRRLLDKLGLIEPSASDITAPRSGYRIQVTRNTDFPSNLSTAPFTDSDRTPIMWAHIRTRSLERKEFRNYYILPLDDNRMEWVPSSGGKIPEGQHPVWGGWDAGDGGMLYHAYGHVHGVDVPGMTSPRIGAALLSWNGSTHRLEDNYHILMWRRDTPILSVSIFDNSDMQPTNGAGSSASNRNRHDDPPTKNGSRSRFSRNFQKLRTLK